MNYRRLFECNSLVKSVGIFYLAVSFERCEVKESVPMFFGGAIIKSFYSTINLTLFLSFLTEQRNKRGPSACNKVLTK